MGATFHSIRQERLPRLLFVDSNIWVGIINRTDHQHKKARLLYERVQEGDTVMGVCRHLLLIEVWQALRRGATSLSARELQMIVEDAEERSQEPQLRFPVVPRPGSSAEDRSAFLVRYGDDLLRRFCDAVPLAPVRLTQALMIRARKEMETWHLKSHDALVLAATKWQAERAEDHPHLATTDGDFDHVADLHVWGRT